ncbi:MAG TPA: glycosyltransferase [Methanoregulaceae archaeon]|nr:glycosyltransferase [Methanoregulaceae archaeon]
MQDIPAIRTVPMKPKIRVVLVGPSIRFLSGISYYTIRLANAISESTEVTAVLFRNMLPRRFFPGWKRVGDPLSTVSYTTEVKVMELLDWYSPISWMRAAAQLRKADIIIFQWWTSSVAHMYAALQFMLFRNVPIIIEYHEVVDPLEHSILPIRIYSVLMGRIIRTRADGYVVHSEADRALVETSFHVPHDKVMVIPHGLYDQYSVIERSVARKQLKIAEKHVILFFGLLRPYKGVKNLIEAFDSLPTELLHSSRLLIVGEAWEDKDALARAEKSPNREQITIVSRYIADDEVPIYFSAADLIALPYTRASQSGVAHIAMAFGLPIIATKVGGLEEGLQSYSGALFIAPNNNEELKRALVQLLREKGSFPPPANLAWSGIGKKWTTFLLSVILNGSKKGA